MTFESQLSADALALLHGLDTPQKIQAYLDSIPYSPDDLNRPPLEVLHDGKAHCLDGALFAAAALRRIGHPALVVDMLPEPGLDDDHVLAIFRVDGLIGALAKSNFTGLRFREAIHRTLRELVLSYFEDFYNVNGIKTLRAYTGPLDLAGFDVLEWETRRTGVNAIEERLYTMRRYPVLPAAAVARLSPLDARSFEAGMMGANPDGLYKPRA